jgi:acylphosphatase
MKACAQIRVYGLVQGVFYREFTRRKASGLGLLGWVHNLPDGSVEVLAQGFKEDILELIALLRQGPPSARVNDLQITWQDMLDDLTGFEITY